MEGRDEAGLPPQSTQEIIGMKFIVSIWSEDFLDTPQLRQQLLGLEEKLENVLRLVYETGRMDALNTSERKEGEETWLREIDSEVDASEAVADEEMQA